jgi:hypothetical protein
MEGCGGTVRILSIIDQWPFNAGEGADIEEVVGRRNYIVPSAWFTHINLATARFNGKLRTYIQIVA